MADQRCANAGRFIEVVGCYNPMARGKESKLSLNQKRIQDWIQKGAQPTKRVKNLMKTLETKGES